MPRMDDYKHLNHDNDGAVLCIEDMAYQVDKLNYGSHRLLSAIARIRLDKRPDDQLGRGLKKLLDDGAF